MVLLPSAAMRPAAVSIALRSWLASAVRRLLLSSTTFCCFFASASLEIVSSAPIQPGVSDAIWLSVVQRKLGTTFRRSTTFHWKASSTAAITTNPRTTATQSSVRHRFVAAV